MATRVAPIPVAGHADTLFRFTDGLAQANWTVQSPLESYEVRCYAVPLWMR